MPQGMLLTLAKDLVIQLMSGVLKKVRLFGCYLSHLKMVSPLFSIILLSFSGGWTFIMDLTCIDQSLIVK